MIDRYKELSDTVPHEEYIVCITESSRYKGHEFNTVVEEIKSRIRGDKLSLQQIYPDIEKSNDYDRLIQNSVWILYLDDCISSTESGPLFKEEYLELQTYLKIGKYPDDAGVFLCIDDVTKTQRSEIEQTFPELIIADTKDMLVGMIIGHFAEANPISTRGQKKILSWNNDVCDTLGIP